MAAGRRNVEETTAQGAGDILGASRVQPGRVRVQVQPRRQGVSLQLQQVTEIAILRISHNVVCIDSHVCAGFVQNVMHCHSIVHWRKRTDKTDL